MARILVVDNNARDRVQMVNALEPAGHKVIETPDGKVAIETALERPPDCIVMDLVLCGVDGMKVIRTLRQHGLAMPIIVQTSLSHDAMRDACLSMGATAFLRKPVNGIRLSETVRELLAATETALPLASEKMP